MYCFFGDTMKNKVLLILIVLLISTFLFADPPAWEALQGTQYSMVVMANISLYGENFVASGNNMAAAFGPDGENDCRSVATWQEPNPPYYNGFWFFTIVANIENGLITFKIYDETSDTIYNCDGAITFANNTTIGTPQTPYNLNIATSMITGNIYLTNTTGTTGNVENVLIQAGNATTNPDSNGFYSLTIDTGIYDISVSLNGYISSTIYNVVVSAGQTTENVNAYLIDWQPITGTQYSMVVMATVKYNDANIIGESGYQVAAFGNGGYQDCRGIAYWQEPNPPYWDGYWYFTVLSNSQGDQISFKLFDTESGDIIDCYQTLSFEDNTTVGSPEEPWEISNGSQQVFNLTQGWNWISFNVVSAESSIDSIFYSLDSDIYQIKSQNQSATYYSGPGMWVGDLTDIDPLKGYLVFMNQDHDNFSIYGTAVNPSTHIALTSGWNWISYLPQFDMDIDDALQSVENNVYQLKNQNHSATYYNPPGTWVGDLQTMQPKKCYKINMTAADELVYQAGRESHLPTSDLVRDNEPNWQPITGTEYSMVLMASVEFNELPFEGTNENNIVAAFGPAGEDDCRAIAVWEDANPPYWDGYWYFTIVGNENNEDISFKIYNAERDSIYNCEESISFSNDQTVGDPFSPYAITANNNNASSPEETISEINFLGNAYPNPFSITNSKSKINIEYNIKKNETGELAIYNLKGQKIRTYPLLQGRDNIVWDIKDTTGKNVGSGIYFYKLQTTSFAQIRKLIIIR